MAKDEFRMAKDFFSFAILDSPFPIHTLLRLRGRQPLCGMGVTSLMDFTSMPAACRARTADSRPAPGPLTSTSTDRIPASLAEHADASLTPHPYGVHHDHVDGQNRNAIAEV